MKILENKKGTDKIMSVYWFVILFIVAGAVVYMVGMFYGNPYDVREIEANVLINHIADCIAEGGMLKQVINNDNFLEACNLDFNVENFKDGEEQEQYYVEINFDKELITKGNVNLKDFCNLKEKSVACVERGFYVLDEEKNSKEIKILSVVRKTEKNVQ